MGTGNTIPAQMREECLLSRGFDDAFHYSSNTDEWKNRMFVFPPEEEQ